jgi:ketosteroid isomerase-like protein
MTNPSSTVPVTQLPPAIRSYLTAHEARDVDGALAAFTSDARVTDQGEAFEGTPAVRRFLSGAGADTFTTQHLGAQRTADSAWDVHVRIEGDFPGGTADLTYRFELADDLVRRLDIRS